MAKYLLAYTGGRMAQSEAEREQVMAAWGAWFGALGPAIVDPGNPLAASATVSGGGAMSNGGRSGLTGYSLLNADSLEAAVEHAKGCPVLSNSGSVEVYEAHEIS